MATVTRTNKTTGQEDVATVDDLHVFTVLAHVYEWDGYMPETYQQISAGTWRWETTENRFTLSAPIYERD